MLYLVWATFILVGQLCVPHSIELLLRNRHAFERASISSDIHVGAGFQRKMDLHYSRKITLLSGATMDTYRRIPFSPPWRKSQGRRYIPTCRGPYELPDRPLDIASLAAL